MPFRSFTLDPRYFQVTFQAVFLSYGLLILGWEADWLHYTICIAGCVFVNYLLESLWHQHWMPLTGSTGFMRWGFSVVISAMSLCLLLKTGHWTTSAFAVIITVLSKYIFRFSGKHIFNPSAFGIVITLLATNDAWLSPGQWGSNAVIFFFVITLGTIVVTRVQKLDISVAFLVTYVGLLYWRQVMVLGWPLDHFLHSVSTGSLLLFTFFMISDPKTAPNHWLARIIWAVIIAGISFYLAAFKWKYNTIIWVLVAAAPLVPLLDRLFKGAQFQWKISPVQLNILPIKKKIMKPFIKKSAALVLVMAMLGHEAMAFCGFYVSKADGTLKNKTSQVIIVRDGDRNVITMYNDFKGNLKDFAMVVPVPVVLQKNDIKVVDQQIFNTLNEYSQPRLVEYYDENPCSPRYDYELLEKKSKVSNAFGAAIVDSSVRFYNQVKIEAKYIVGEYDILILSAKESGGLKDWLNANGYKIPAAAEEVLEPYIKSNLKFFVVKVNEAEKKKLAGDFLRPIQISFNSPKFMLPIRLGMANADGDQDMIVYGISKKGRIECVNYRTVAIPTSKNIPLFVQNNFNNFYTNLFQHQWIREGKSVAMLEYAWDVSPKNFVKCDPCVAEAPSVENLIQAGVWWVAPEPVAKDGLRTLGSGDKADVFFTRLHVRYNRKSFPQDLVFQVTPNSENYQARYIVTHPATGDLSCAEGQKYLKTLKEHRRNELEMLSYLTGKTYENWDMVAINEEEHIPEMASYDLVAAESNNKNPDNRPYILAGLTAVGLISLYGANRRIKR